QPIERLSREHAGHVPDEERAETCQQHESRRPQALFEQGLRLIGQVWPAAGNDLGYQPRDWSRLGTCRLRVRNRLAIIDFRPGGVRATVHRCLHIWSNGACLFRHMEAFRTGDFFSARTCPASALTATLRVAVKLPASTTRLLTSLVVPTGSLFLKEERAVALWWRPSPSGSICSVCCKKRLALRYLLDERTAPLGDRMDREYRKARTHCPAATLS